MIRNLVLDTLGGYSSKNVSVAAGNYKSNTFKRIFVGEHYRKSWRAPVTVPVIDIWNMGLIPYKTGGNMQSIVLHLHDQKGKKYVLRSVQKNHSKTVPEGLRNTFVVDIVQDQVSSMHPYGAFVVPILAEAAGIFHTNPRLVYIPDDPRLGQYQKVYGGMLALFEQKPEGDHSTDKNFGNSKEVIGTPELLLKVRESSLNRVDERNFLRARLLDMFIGDWDRSEDQWAWAGFKSGSVKVYKPIPRDRDQAFIKMDGIIPWIYSRKWSARKIQGFKNEIPDIIGLNMNAKTIDRSFLTSLCLKDWENIADSVTNALNDNVIESAVQQWPDTIFKLDGKELIEKLKYRREHLKETAIKYYKVLSEFVDVAGSDEPEKFEVTRIDKDSTKVRISGITHDSLHPQIFYDRTFRTKETKEVRLYGLDGKDEFFINGKAKDGIIVRLIGGDGKDTIADNSIVLGPRRKTKVYDIKEQTGLKLSKESKDLTSYDVRVNDYDRTSFLYDAVFPRFLFEYNIDDGFLIGAGIGFKHYGFRKKPYSSFHKVSASTSLKTQSYYFRYDADMIRVLKKWDINSILTVSPYAATNFYGFGNESKKTPGKVEDFNLVRINEIKFFPAFKKSDAPNVIFKIGPEYQFFEVRKSDTSFIGTPLSGLVFNNFAAKHFLGPKFVLEYNNVNDNIFPTKGIRWNLEGSWTFSLDKTSNSFSNIKSELCFFIPVKISLPATLCFRSGGASNFDSFEFFQSNMLGGYSYPLQQGEENVRGYRRNRFAGRSTLFQNAELRTRLFNFVKLGQLGVLGYGDIGRVWMDGEISNIWHSGYGGGIWVAPLNKLVLTFTYSVSEEDQLFNLHMGFLF